MKNEIVHLIRTRHKALFEFWTNGTIPSETFSIENYCDVVYTLVLLGLEDKISAEARWSFIKLLDQYNLAGWRGAQVQSLSVHNTAYLFGALNLTTAVPSALYEKLLSERSLEISQIVDQESKLPNFPREWAHHNWRVSHWIGGIPSLILSVANSGSSYSAEFRRIFSQVRSATESLVDPQSGLLKAYKSELVQKIFRILYSLRHDPELGDIGGVAHLLWVDYSIGRRYTGLVSLLERSRKLLGQHAPFMEKVPYCLDFDVVQILRTAREQAEDFAQADVIRARKLMEDIESFFVSDIPENYSLHKIPGALATYHECALINRESEIDALRMKPVDIIKRANWL